MISSITSVLTGIEQPDGQTIANARGFTDNDDNGALNVEMGEDWSGDEPVSVSSMYYAVSLAANTTYTIDYNGTADEMTMPSVQFEDISGQAQGTPMTGEWDAGWTEYTVTPASFTTPNTAGIYYIHISYSGDWTTIPLLVSPRPQEYSCVTRRLWKAYPWETNAEGDIVKFRASGIPKDVLVMPLLTSATPTVNTAGATFESSGSITFDGTGASVASDDSGNRIKVFMPNVFAGSYTVTLCFNPVSDSGNRNIFELREMTPAYYNNEHTIPVSFNSGKTLLVNLFGKGEKRLLSEEPKKSAWHCISVAVDRKQNEIRMMLDGKITSSYVFSAFDIANGIMGSNGCINLFGTQNGDSPELGKIKQLLVTDSAMGYDQMRYLSSKLLS